MEGGPPSTKVVDREVLDMSLTDICSAVPATGNVPKSSTRKNTSDKTICETDVKTFFSLQVTISLPLNPFTFYPTPPTFTFGEGSDEIQQRLVNLSARVTTHYLLLFWYNFFDTRLGFVFALFRSSKQGP